MPDANLSDSKRKGTPGISEVLLGQSIKKPRLDMASASSVASSASPASSSRYLQQLEIMIKFATKNFDFFYSAGSEGVNEESVRRYVSRKPMTTTELLQKFKHKKTGLTSDQLVHHIAQILKKINPVKQTIKGKMYLSIKG